MPISLSAYFNHRGGALFLAAMLVSPYASLAGSAPRPDGEEQDLSIALLVPQSRICVGLKSVFNPHTPVERYLARQYFGTQRTKIGRLLLNAEEAEPLQVCYDRALDKANECGFYAIGKFDGKLLLNPAERVTDTRREVFSLHEVRHRFQRRIGLDYGGGGNIPERERVVLYWMNEADARLTGILYAFEKAERGDKSQLQAVADDQTMINAFYKTLNQDRTNVPEAARMAMLAFLEQKSFLADYANSTLDWIDQARKAYDPEQPATTLLSREKLMKMGEIGYGNYMTDAVIDAFDQAFSPENYQSLKTARANKGGRVCRL